MKERIISFLAQGLKPSQVASIVGCTPGYVTQVAKDPVNAARLAEVIAEVAPTLTDDKVINNKYLAVEHRILNQLEVMADQAEFRDLARALDIVSTRQEKRLQRLTPQLPQGHVTTLINIQLPAHATMKLPSYKLNENKEVIAIGEQTMSPLSSEGVKNLFAQLSNRAQPIEAATIIDSTEF